MCSSVSKAAFLLVQHKICQFLVIKYYFRVQVSERVVVRDVDEILPSLTGKCRHHVSNDVDSTCGGCPEGGRPCDGMGGRRSAAPDRNHGADVGAMPWLLEVPSVTVS
jgi:hypothetical protein